jgi:hypothetical protein
MCKYHVLVRVYVRTFMRQYLHHNDWFCMVYATVSCNCVVKGNLVDDIGDVTPQAVFSKQYYISHFTSLRIFPKGWLSTITGLSQHN